MRLKISYHLLHTYSVFNDLLLSLLGLDPHFEYFVDDLLEILNHVIVLRFEVFVRLVDNADENLSVIL